MWAMGGGALATVSLSIKAARVVLGHADFPLKTQHIEQSFSRVPSATDRAYVILKVYLRLLNKRIVFIITVGSLIKLYSFC